MSARPISHAEYGVLDVEATAGRLRSASGLAARPGSRFPHLGLADWFVPFEDQYITAAAHHESGAKGIAWVEVVGEEEAVHDWIDGADEAVRVRPGEPDLVAVGIATGDDDLVLRA